jgi:hypothetical protein
MKTQSLLKSIFGVALELNVKHGKIYGNNMYKELFDMNLRKFEDLQNTSAKYETKIGTSINCLNFTLAIWAITTTILFNAPLLHFSLVLIYIILSTVLITIVIFGWKKGFSATGFKEFYSFELNSNLNKEFLEGDEDNRNNIYRQNCEILSEEIVRFKGILEIRKQCVKSANSLSIIALAISILLVVIVLFGKIYENYDFKTKPQICIVEPNNNFSNTGVLYENNGTEKESTEQTDSTSGK